MLYCYTVFIHIHQLLYFLFQTKRDLRKAFLLIKMILIFLPYNLERNKLKQKGKKERIYRWTGIFSKKNKKEKNIQASCFSSLIFGYRNLTYPWLGVADFELAPCWRWRERERGSLYGQINWSILELHAVYGCNGCPTPVMLGLIP